MKFSIQPAINYPEGPVGILSAPGYSYRYIGGDATYIIIPNEVMELDCLLALHRSRDITRERLQNLYPV